MQDMRKIQYEMNKPCLELQDFIQTIWFAENLENDSQLDYKILSDAASGIVFNFGDELAYQYGNGETLKEKETITLGPRKELLRLCFSGRVQTVGIRFFPFTGHHFFKTPMADLADRILKTNTEHYLGSPDLYQKLKSMVLKGSSRHKIVQTIESDLIRILQLKNTKPQSQLINLFQAIHLKPEIELEELSLRFSISKRDIQRLFRNYVGVTPKAFLRLNKIRGIKDKIAQDEFCSLTQLSLDAGYFDQAHFIRDFKAFMEDSPKKYYEYKKELKNK